MDLWARGVLRFMHAEQREREMEAMSVKTQNGFQIDAKDKDGYT